MNIGVLTWNPNSFRSTQLIEATRKKGVNTFTLNFNQLTARVSYRQFLSIEDEDLAETSIIDYVISLIKS